MEIEDDDDQQYSNKTVIAEEYKTTQLLYIQPNLIFEKWTKIREILNKLTQPSLKSFTV